MTTTKEDVASRAFLMIGANTVSDFTDGSSDESDLANLLYEELVQAELGSYPWNFTKSEVLLSLDATAPLGGEWDSRYRIDTRAITVRGVRVEGSNIAYEIQEDFIHCNATSADSVYMEFLGRTSEAKWPAYFQLGMVYRLASDFAGSLARDGELVQIYDVKYEKQIRRARAMDSQSETARPLRTQRLVKVRQSGSRYFPGAA